MSGTSGRRVLGIALTAAVLLVGASTPMASAARTPRLGSAVTLRGASSGYVTVQLTQWLSADCPGVTSCAPRAALRLVGGAYGYALQSVTAWTTHEPPTALVVRLPAEEGNHVESIVSGKDSAGHDVADDDRLPPGQYRLTLLTHGPGAVSVRFPGLLGTATTLSVAHGLSVVTSLKHAPTLGPLATSGWADGLTVTPTSDAHGYVFDWERGAVAAVFSGGVCSYPGAPPGGVWLPGCPGGSLLLSNAFTPQVGCCGTGYGVVISPARQTFSFGASILYGGPMTSAGMFLLLLPSR